MSFGDQRVGTRSASQTLTVRNTGADPVTVTSVKRIGAGANDFRSTPPGASFTVSPGAAATVALAFQPVQAGVRSGTLEVVYSNQWCPAVKLTVGLTGTGVVPNVVVDPNPIDAGSSPIGKEGKPVSIVIANDGKAPLKITAIQVIGTDAADFSLKSLPLMPVSVLPSGTITFEVRMTPSAQGLRSASLNILSDDHDAPAFAVPLRGTAGPSAAPSVRPTTSRTPSPSTKPSTPGSSSSTPQALGRPGNDSLAVGMVVAGVVVVFGGLMFIRRLVAEPDEE